VRGALAIIALLAFAASVSASKGVASSPEEGAALFSAISESDCALVGSLLDDGVDVSVRDEIGATPLMRALEKSLSRSCVRMLLQAGADPNATHGSADISVLMIAASYSTAEIVSLLLESGAEAEFTTPDGWTALMSAARNSAQPGVIRELVAAGADINVRDGYGVTALMRAAQTNPNPDIVETLVRLGANPKTKTADGHTAYGLAKAAGRGPEYLALLANGRPCDVDND
jgi:ankyrin repeat protein